MELKIIRECLVVLFMEKIGILLLKYIKTHIVVFGCHSAGDTIRFVENLFNLSFIESMQKINLDFNMGLDPHTPVDYKKLNKIKSEQYEHKKIKEKQIRKYCDLCDIKIYYEKIIKYLKSRKINIYNWEKLTSAISYLQTKLFQINSELEILDEKLSSRN